MHKQDVDPNKRTDAFIAFFLIKNPGAKTSGFRIFKTKQAACALTIFFSNNLLKILASAFASYFDVTAAV